MAKTYVLVDEVTLIVGPAMTQDIHHGLDHALIGPIESDDSTHQTSPGLRGTSRRTFSPPPPTLPQLGPSMRKRSRPLLRFARSPGLRLPGATKGDICLSGLNRQGNLIAILRRPARPVEV